MELGVLQENECRCADSLVLLTFYAALNGTEWTESWALNEPLENWKGISLNNGDCVSGITLNANNLQGELPSEIGNLTGLKRLSLVNNNLVGNLPESIGNLRNLESLVLRSNQLSGIIPTNIRKLTKLTTLNLSVNNFSGNIPTQIGDLTSLSGLFLNQNNLSGEIPVQLSNLSELVSLNLSVNELTGEIPNEIGRLTKLVGIGIHNNQLTGGLPTSFGQLEKLVSLRLENNQLSGEIPSTYGDLTKIESFILNDNNLSGCFPESLTNLCNLSENTILFSTGYNFRNNPLLPWEGDFSQFCEGKDQTRATCNDSDENTTEDGINEQCQCGKLTPIVIPEPMLILNINTSGTCPGENQGQVDLAIQPANETYLINWIDSNGDQDAWISGNSFSLDDLVAGDYSLTITSENNENLQIMEMFEIPLLSCTDDIDVSKIPQLITPNGDGLNEQFIFDELIENPNTYDRNELIIFNRWGDIVFEAKPYQNNWSGQNNFGKTLPQGTYYYVFKLDLNEGQIIKGDITIVR